MAWTVAVTYEGSSEWGVGQEQHVFKLACTSDGSSSGDQNLKTLIDATYPTQVAGAIKNNCITGALAYAIKYVPDGTATPTSNPTVTVDDETGGVILSKTFTAGTALAEPFSNTIGFSPPVNNIVVASTTLANAKVASIYIYLIK